ncbi:MAG: NAD(P)/FAD-dependent oxidoreductase [Planctomycetales bacterium]|nr:NAD(P)/FAD-dependent oxidoreductase [Planctomycetales bacterium]
MTMWDTIVIGAGAAGLVAAERSAATGHATLLLEKANKPGVKILMSGGTRCNVTHATDRNGIVAAFGKPGKFLHSALSYLGPQEVVDLFAREGVATKVESTGKVFPVSDRAIDVRDALLRRLSRSGAALRTGVAVTEIVATEHGFQLESTRGSWECRSLILTSGGQSYPGCGTTGDGYRWLAELGHRIVPCVPSLAPLTSSAHWLTALSGLTFDDVRLSLWDTTFPGKQRPKKPIETYRSSLLLTHKGLSGPAAMNVSRGVARAASPLPLLATCDWFPDFNQEQVYERLRDEMASDPRRELVPLLSRWVFKRFAEALVDHLQLDPRQRVAELASSNVRRLAVALKELPIPITGTLGFAKAEVTAGGVALGEVDSRTMASRRVPGLYLAGEILDLDGPIGGFNFQAAFATGWVAGYQGQAVQAWQESLGENAPGE